MRRRIRSVGAGLALATALLLAATAGPAAAATLPAGLPADVPAAAATPASALPEPSATAWPFPSTFPQTSGTRRLAFSHLRRGTRVLVNGRPVARAGRRGTAAVRLPAGRTPVVLRP